MARKIGLIAGWGELPVVIARHLRDQGDEVYCVGLIGHADARLEQICSAFEWGAVSRTRSHMRFFSPSPSPSWNDGRQSLQIDSHAKELVAAAFSGLDIYAVFLSIAVVAK